MWPGIAITVISCGNNGHICGIDTLGGLHCRQTVSSVMAVPDALPIGNAYVSLTTPHAAASLTPSCALDHRGVATCWYAAL